MDKSFREKFFKINSVMFLLLPLFLMFFFVVYAGNQEECFLRANKCYNESNWKEALQLYQSIEQKGASVWYNMGNCFYKIGSYHNAIICWKRAERGTLYTDYYNSIYNQNIVRTVCGKQQKQTLGKYIIAIITKSFFCITLFWLQMLFLLFLYVSFILKRYKRKLFLGLSIFSCIVTGMIGAGILVKKIHMHPIGIIIKEKVGVFTGPNNAYHIVHNLEYIDQVGINYTIPCWHKITYTGGEGWVPADAVQVV